MKNTLTITCPDDWHVHLRDGQSLHETVKSVARSFNRAIVMPNIIPPVLTADDAATYKARILRHIPDKSQFTPLMTLYLTDKTSAEIVYEAKCRGDVFAFKLYPAGTTTNSESGVTDLGKVYTALETMAKCGLPLLVHGEVTDTDIDIFDRERAFIDRHLKPLTKKFPTLKIVLEHITTAEAVAFVQQSGDNIAATITAHHLLCNRNHLLAGGIKPHYYCLPILKHKKHQDALLKAATSGNPCFFLGTDSAPHTQSHKESACGCAGCYTAPAALEMYTEAFEAMNSLDKLKGFASHHGPDFYGLPRNTGTITLTKTQWKIPLSIPLGTDQVIPFKAGETMHWKLKQNSA
ncbi:MAG: dihydroorotase [Candidatus Endonucleobacter bathymodioli]|uniref:Dihydroorotase n=1 Tax=Candidatus Endonucleibacter bathymodioli TaxID=539814 RepID=A0AA90NW21_9GAMM|nr:dihydroorotase [Candidatus Endonucleobacter bathymodioli]